MRHLHVNFHWLLTSSGHGRSRLKRGVKTSARRSVLLLCFTGNKAAIYGGISPQCYESQHERVTGIWPRTPTRKKKTTVSRSSYRTLSYLATISARSWSSFTAASCSVSDAERTNRGGRGEGGKAWMSYNTNKRPLCSQRWFQAFTQSQREDSSALPLNAPFTAAKTIARQCFGLITGEIQNI